MAKWFKSAGRVVVASWMRVNVVGSNWSGREDLNLRPPGPEPENSPFFEIRKNQELEVVDNAAVTRCCFGADSAKLKTRRVPPTPPPSPRCRLPCEFLFRCRANRFSQQSC